jgi:hypothetical protein
MEELKVKIVGVEVFIPGGPDNTIITTVGAWVTSSDPENPRR